MIRIDNNCTACGACVKRCPTSCIQLLEDSSGFIYPAVDGKKCINCDACSRVCHLNMPIEKHENEQRAYAVVSKSASDLGKATSGGSFPAIARFVLGRGGVVYGCTFVDHLQAKHIRIDSVDDLEKLSGSKYVQSDISSYKEVRDDLNNGLLVLFSGTPCQVAGLKAFLGKKYDNLLTVDIVCHGVPPQSYFDKYIDMFEKKNRMRVTDFSFRSKDNCGWSLAGMCRGIDNKTAKSIKKKIFYYKEFYYYFFLKGYIYRESCYSCRYACRDRVGDFSLGDLWGAKTLDIPFSTEKGCSMVLANNQKADSILADLDCLIKEIPLETAVKYNMQLAAPSPMPAERPKVLALFQAKDARGVNDYFIKAARKERVKGFIKYHLPKGAKKLAILIKNKIG